MAVTKIRKISSWTLLACVVISVIALLMFYIGGVEDPAAEMATPVNTDLLLNWTYVLFGLTVVSTVIFAIWQFIGTLKTNTKGALMGLGAIVVFIVVMFIAYSIGDTTPLASINADSAHYNTPFWLKVTDMWIYTTYILIGLIILAVVLGNVKKLFGK
ncbi:MAG: hypothetical protein LUE98_02260 [Tannerellaceae bacterium]|nr:hypothetical protein [Tannerellaceae bacterium]